MSSLERFFNAREALALEAGLAGDVTSTCTSYDDDRLTAATRALDTLGDRFVAACRDLAACGAPPDPTAAHHFNAAMKQFERFANYKSIDEWSQSFVAGCDEFDEAVQAIGRATGVA